VTVATPRFPGLAAWLDWQQSLHPSAIELGLARVSRVLARTGWRRPEQPVFTVGGTNGKGSCVAMLDAILRASGNHTGTFTSPHLVDYRERIRLDGEWVSEAALVAAFERIADALGDDSLTFFEFNTLAALLIFETRVPDAIVLEVGMGGRLDAVNLVDADVALVTSVSLDHMEWLGPDVETIGREKAGIFRAGRPAICGMRQPPRSVIETARAVGAPLKVLGRHFDGVPRGTGAWDYLGEKVQWTSLPRPALAGETQIANAATVLAALEQASDRIPLDRAAVERGLKSVELAGRFERRPDRRGFEWILDVAHNPDSARVLAANLREFPVGGRTLAVCGMLADKDIASVLAALRHSFDAWFAATTRGSRGLSDAQLASRARSVGIEMACAGDVEAAMRRAASVAGVGDRIVLFGSFHTVGPALSLLQDPL
jgi:dihydrofolate synthase/folylpolyglutamate synthase